MTTALEQTLQDFVGLTSGPPRLADDAVSAPMIRHWCQAMGDHNPVYTDPEFAAHSPLGGIVAPPTMLQTWTHHDRRFPLPAGENNAEERLAQVLAAAGFTGVVATSCRASYVRYLHLGDRTSYQSRIDSVSPLKQTALGHGYFIVVTMTIRDQADEVVGTIEFTTLRYRPREGAG
jgi:acyl dehydratase